MFIAILFTIARKWMQSKSSTKEEWIKMMWYTYTTGYYSARKRMK